MLDFRIWADGPVSRPARLRRHRQGESGHDGSDGLSGWTAGEAGASLADIVAGLYAFNGILLALLARHKTGRGQLVDVSLLDGMVSTLTYQALIYLATGRSPKRVGTRHPSIVPYECFQAKDGFVNIAVTNQKQWENFCQVLGFRGTRSRSAVRIDESAAGELQRTAADESSGLSRNMTRAEVIAAMAEVGIPAGPINTVGEILEDPQIHARRNGGRN